MLPNLVLVLLLVLDIGIFKIGSRLSAVPIPPTPSGPSLSAFSDHPGEKSDF